MALIITKMRDAETIYEDTKRDAESGNNSCGLMSIVKVAINNAKMEMYDFLCEQSSLEENKNLTLEEFFNKMYAKTLFEDNGW